MKVLKFGGTSVGTVESLRNVKMIIDSLSEPAIVVVSALGGLTDRLIATARAAADSSENIDAEMCAMRRRHEDIILQLVPEEKQCEVSAIVSDLLSQLENIYRGVSLIGDLPEKTLDQIVSFGERMSSVIVTNILQNAEHHDSLEFIKTEKWFNRNIADRQFTDRLIREEYPLPLKRTCVMGGFISRDRDTGEITNLGRGGSDYTAALVAAALDADSLEIWTDVDGFMTADPRIIPDARIIPDMSYIESMELCSFGAKVIYPPTIYPVFHKNIPIKILNTFHPTAAGTRIKEFASGTLPRGVRGVSSVKNTSIVTVVGNLADNVAEINSRTYNAMARNGISIFLVSQPDSDEKFSVAMAESETEKALRILRDEFAPELQSGQVASVEPSHNLAIVAVVGEAIHSESGLGARLTNTLQREGIEVRAVSDGASDTTIAIVVDNANVENSLKLVHEACFPQSSNKCLKHSHYGNKERKI